MRVRGHALPIIMAKHNYPIRITIPTPMHTPVVRGPQARQGPYALNALGTNMRVRVSRMDGEIIDEVCKKLDMKRTEFFRWCAVETAKALHKLDTE